MKFRADQRVKKVGGTYKATGVIKSAFNAHDGTPRYVFQFDYPHGLLHIFNESQIVSIDDD